MSSVSLFVGPTNYSTLVLLIILIHAMIIVIHMICSVMTFDALLFNMNGIFLSRYGGVARGMQVEAT